MIANYDYTDGRLTEYLYNFSDSSGDEFFPREIASYKEFNYTDDQRLIGFTVDRMLSRNLTGSAFSVNTDDVKFVYNMTIVNGTAPSRVEHSAGNDSEDYTYRNGTLYEISYYESADRTLVAREEHTYDAAGRLTEKRRYVRAAPDATTAELLSVRRTYAY